MTTFLIVRHGQSVANEMGVFAGDTDHSLTPLGHRQAEITAEYIAKNYNVDAVYTSPLCRAKETAEHTSEKLGIKPNAVFGLREISAGDWNNKKFDDLVKEYPEEYGIWLNDIGNSQCPNGENPNDVQKRVIGTLLDIAKENENKTVAVFSHGMAIRCAEAVWQNKDIKDLKDIPWVTNASLTVVEYSAETGFNLVERSIDGYLEECRTFLPANC